MPSRDDPVRLLACCGGTDLAAIAGFLAQAAVRHIPVVLDGVIVGACALLAEMLAPGARSWWVAGHCSAEPAHAAALRALELSPLVDLGLRLGEGSGAVCAVPLLRGAIHCMTDMTTFDDVEVSGRLDAQDGIGPRFTTSEV
ncbi:nicotinate-nucleotide--dimethylbenzimidazole phosphoribosyltransferase [Lawsonella clevelandensis]|uniref:nicotinate-nucleotide--dimethylbenzimidazole phosphoribosyltransferase n=1 Tax=Lawsonella clevelandensis TaxID=1528099 RepID=UPI0030B8DF7C